MHISVDDTFLHDPDDENLYGPPGMGAVATRPVRVVRNRCARPAPEVVNAQRLRRRLAELRAKQVGTAVALTQPRSAKWQFAPTDRPRWAYGDEKVGPRDYTISDDIVPRWVGLPPQGTKAGYPLTDPPPWMPGDAFGMGQADQSMLKAAFGSTEIVLKSQISPPVTMRPFAPNDKPQSEANVVSKAVMGFVKPAIYLKTPMGLTPLFQPYGEPVNDYSGPVALGVVVVTAATAWLGYKALKKLLA